MQLNCWSRPGGQRREGVQEDEELPGGERIGRLADDQAAEHPLEHRQRVHGTVVVIQPRALRAGAGVPHVLERLAVLDEAAGLGVLALVGAVHVMGVEDPVRVHRDRHAGLVAEIDHDGVPGLRLQQWPRDLGRPQRLGKAGGPRLVGERRERGLPGDLPVHHPVVMGGDDVPLGGPDGLDPVCLNLAGGRSVPRAHVGHEVRVHVWTARRSTPPPWAAPGRRRSTSGCRRGSCC